MDKKIVQLLEDIKKLLIFDLLTRGVQGKDIAEALGVNKSTISRLVSARKTEVKKK